MGAKARARGIRGSAEKKTWIVNVSLPGKESFWFGNYQAANRNDAKENTRIFVNKYLPLNARIVCIAEGSVTVTITGKEIYLDE